jgi:signal transduction histidine kinase
MDRDETGLQRIGRTRLGPFTVLEWAPTALLVPLAIAQILGGMAGHLVGPAGGVAPFVVGGAAALLWRRRRPLEVLGIVCALTLVPAIAWGSTQSMAIAFTMAVAVFACGAHGRRPSALLGPFAGIATTLVFIANDPTESLAVGWTWALNLLWIYGFGAWVHQNHRLVEQAGAESAALAAAAAAEDRVRIARELHDILGHNLAVMIVQAEAADEVLDNDPAQAHRALAHVQDTGRAALDDIRRLVGALRLGPAGDARSATPVGPGVVAVPSLVGAVRASGLPVVLEVSGDLTQVPELVGQAVYRMVQEALTNTLRHAGPVPTQVSVSVADDELRVRVHDVGSSARSAPGPEQGPDSPGHGLRGMRERIESVGGRMQAEPDQYGGFTVSAQVPAVAVAP